MAGRRPVPIEIKKLKGTYRKCRDKDSPPPSESTLIAPKWLNKRAKGIFNTLRQRLESLNMGSQSYTESVSLLASRMEEVKRYTEIVESEGYMTERADRNGTVIIKLHPAVRMREAAMNHAHKLLIEFGLTAASIQRIGKPPGPKKKNAFDDF